MLLSYNQLVKLVNEGVINAPLKNINGASIDITLGNVFKKEVPPKIRQPLDIRKHSIDTQTLDLQDDSYFILNPGDFVLVETREVFNLPDTIACEYKEKSSMARNGINHMLAGWGDPTWHGSTMTLELHNVTRHHSFALQPGMKIGQIVFWGCWAVPDEVSYKNTGQYNNQSGAQGSKGVK